MPLICAAQETAQQDIIPYVSRLSVYADDAYLELTIGSVAQNKLYLCDVEDLVIRDSKGNVLTGNHVSYSDSYIDEFIPDNSTSVDLHILDRIKGGSLQRQWHAGDGDHTRSGTCHRLYPRAVG